MSPLCFSHPRTHARTSVHRGGGSESAKKGTRGCHDAQCPSTVHRDGNGARLQRRAMCSAVPLTCSQPQLLHLWGKSRGEPPARPHPNVWRQLEHVGAHQAWAMARARGRTPAAAPRASRLTSGGPPPHAGTNVLSQDAVLPSCPPVSAQAILPFHPDHSKYQKLLWAESKGASCFFSKLTLLPPHPHPPPPAREMMLIGGDLASGPGCAFARVPRTFTGGPPPTYGESSVWPRARVYAI